MSLRNQCQSHPGVSSMPQLIKILPVEDALVCDLLVSSRTPRLKLQPNGCIIKQIGFYFRSALFYA